MKITFLDMKLKVVKVINAPPRLYNQPLGKHMTGNFQQALLYSICLRQNTQTGAIYK